jgi:hypothetical protein
MSITRTSTDKSTIVSPEDVTREIFAAMADGANMRYYCTWGIELTGKDGTVVLYVATSSIARSELSALLTFWAPTDQPSILIAYRAFTNLHAILRRSRTIERYTPEDLQFAIKLVWQQSRSGDPHVLEHLLALIGGNVHRESVVV